MMYIGYWKEHRIDRYGVDSEVLKKWKINNSIFDEEFGNKELYKNIYKTYMESCPKVEIVRGWCEDAFDNSETFGPIFSYTDGTWVWSKELIYYYDKYNLLLPKPFIDHMKKNKFKCQNKKNLPLALKQIITIPSLKQYGE